LSGIDFAFSHFAFSQFLLLANFPNIHGDLFKTNCALSILTAGEIHFD